MGSHAAPALGGWRILLVEDATETRNALGVLLQAEGADVVSVATGREAAEAAVSGMFDVLLTDLGLPDIPGDVLIRQVLGTAPGRPRVVVVTGYGEPHIGRAREAGAEVILLKPVEWTHLLRELTARRAAQAKPRAVA